jgi:hypothetical protein
MQKTKKDKQFFIENNDISDDYHTFSELYDYRMIYNALYVNEIHNKGQSEQYKLHKSMKHCDGEVCFDGKFFIVSMELSTGKISNHYKKKYWDLFKIPEYEKSIIEYDGHSPKDVKNRIIKFFKKNIN